MYQAVHALIPAHMVNLLQELLREIALEMLRVAPEWLLHMCLAAKLNFKQTESHHIVPNDSTMSLFLQEVFSLLWRPLIHLLGRRKRTTWRTGKEVPWT